MKKNLLLIIFSFCNFCTSFAQEDPTKYNVQELDSLLNAFSQARAYHLLLPYAQVGVEKADKEFGNQDTTYAKMLYFLGFGLHVRQDFSNAEYYYKQSIEIIKNKSPKSPKHAAVMVNLGILYSTMERYEEAENAYKKSMELYKDIFGFKNSNYALSLNNLASLYIDLGRYDDAEKLLKQSLQIKKETIGDQHLDYASGLNNLANTYIEMGNYEAAEALYKEALNIRKKNLSTSHPSYAQSLTNLATLFSRMGHYSNAEPLIRQALGITKEAFGIKNPDYITNLENLAILYSRMENYNDAEPIFKEVLALRKEVFGVKHHFYANTLSSLANVYSITNRYKEAEALYREALSIKKETLGPQHPLYASALSNLGLLLEEVKRSEEAEKAYFEVRAICLNNYPKNHPACIQSVNHLADLYKNTHQYDKSLDYVLEAISTNSSLPMSKNITQKWADSLKNARYSSDLQILESLKILYKIHSILKKSAEESIIIELILYLLKQNRDAFSSEEDKLVVLAESNDWTLRGLKILDKKAQIEKAFAFAEQSKSVLLLEAAKTDYAHTFGDLPDSLIHQQDLLQKHCSKLEAELLENHPQQEKDSLLNVLNHLNFEIKEFKKNIEKNYPKYAHLKYQHHDASLKEVQSILDDKTAIIEYVIGDSVVYIFYIDQKNAKIAESFITKRELTNQIKKLHNALSNYAFINEKSDEAYLAYISSAHWCYQNLLEPVLPKTPNTSKIENLIIVTDGEMGHLPFEAFLTTAADQKTSDYATLPYLVKDYNVSYNYSATLLVDSKKESKNKTSHTTGKLLAMVANYTPNPDSTFASHRLPAYQRLRQTLIPLPAAEQEVKMLEEIFQGLFVFGNDASEKIFKENASNYSIIHLAMHGLLDNKTPILSSLAFTEDGDSIENNFLQAFEISKLKLNADLVVLSACETGYGRFEHGNGIASLARSFMYAGASSLIVSLWQVNDYSTAEIMKNFYQNLETGMPKDAALRQAKLDYLKKAKGIAAHPAFWSAFVQLGDSAPVEIYTPTNWKWVFLLGGIALILGTFFIWKRQKHA